MPSNIDNICNIHPMILSLCAFDAIFSSILSIFTIPLNLIIFITILRYSHLLYRSFYLIIANIALADLIAGLVTCPLSVNFHTKEALNATISQTDTQTLHFTFFVTNKVSVLSMALLSIDRLGVLFNPFTYYQKFTKLRTYIMLGTTWIVSISLATLYFKFGYIRFLAIFSISTVMVAGFFMIATYILFKFRLKQCKNEESAVTGNQGPRKIDNRAKKQRQTLNNFTQMDKTITKTFIWMLLLFLVNYLPAVIITTYMNICTDCSCTFIHIMRDFIFLSILSSGLWRGINFLICLSALRGAVKIIIPFWKDNTAEKAVIHSMEFQ